MNRILHALPTRPSRPLRSLGLALATFAAAGAAAPPPAETPAAAPAAPEAAAAAAPAPAAEPAPAVPTTPAPAPVAAAAFVPAAVAFVGATPGLAAVGATDGTVRLMDLALAREVRRLPAVARIQALAASDDGRWVAAASDHALQILAVEDGRRAVSAALATGAWRLAFAPGAPVLALWSAGAPVQLWRAGDAAPAAVEGLRADALAWSGSGVLVAVEGRTLRFWDVAAARQTREWALAEPATALAISPDGRVVAAGGADGVVALLNAADGHALRRIEAQDRAVSALGFAAPQVLLSAARGEARHLWDTTNGAALRRLGAAVEGCCDAVALSADRRVAMAVAPGRARAWDLASGLSFSELLPQAQPAAAPSAVPALSAEVASVVPAGDGARTGRVVLRVRNGTDAAEARALTVAVATTADGLLALPPAPLERLAPGDKAELAVTVSALAPGVPQPRATTLTLRLLHAGGAGPEVAVPMHLKAPRIVIERVAIEGARARPVVRLQVANTGDDATGPLQLVPAFVRDGAVVGGAPVVRLEDLAAGERAFVGVAATKELLAGGTSLALDARAAEWPTHAWQATADLQRRRPWGTIALSVLGALLLAALLWYLRASRHPVVLQVQRHPEELARYELARLPAANRALRRVRRLDAALTAAKIPPARWARAVQAATSAPAAAEAFAAALGAQLGEKVEGAPAAWRLQLPELRLRFPARTTLAIVEGPELEAGAAAALGAAVHADGKGPAIALALDLTAAQTARPVLHATPAVSFVVLTSAQLRDLLLSPEPAPVLEAAISEQRPLAELSPYRSSGGVEDQALFFGRERELRAIADRMLHNVIVVAPRQMGKSSLLKAAERRLAARNDVEVHYLTLLDDDLPTRVARLLEKPKPETTEQFVELAAGRRRKPRLWIIDEADSFILKDSRNHYPLSLAMRSLSEEGRAYFVLAGFWHLHAAAVLNPNNPLRNFGEMLRLGPLERDAARELAERPMAALGIQYEDPALVDRILDETSCRAHLVIAVCRGLVETLGAEARTIGFGEVERALYQNPGLNDELKVWRREPLSRAVVRATLLAGATPTRGELRDRLAAAGLHPPSDVYAATLDKLELACVLAADAEGRLSCPVPLLRRFIAQEDDLNAGLRRDAADFRKVNEGERLRSAG